jgi:D-3-phosphoglycerate dehydrogenase
MEIAILDDMEETVVKEISKMGKVKYKPNHSELANTQFIIVRSATKVNADLLDKAPKTKFVARAGVGLDNIDQKECEKRGIKVYNTPNASSNAVAELALGLIFSLLRNTPKADKTTKEGKWEKKSLVGSELSGKTLGIIGYGRIGSLLGQKAMALGVKVIASSKEKPPEGVEFLSLEEVIKRSDIISIHAPLTNETRGMVNEAFISKMKKNAILINTSRGEIIDEKALFNALKEKKIAGAALDVFSKEPYTGELSTLENVVLTPHIGASTNEAQNRIGEELIKILRSLLN